MVLVGRSLMDWVLVDQVCQILPLIVDLLLLVIFEASHRLDLGPRDHLSPLVLDLTVHVDRDLTVHHHIVDHPDPITSSLDLLDHTGSDPRMVQDSGLHMDPWGLMDLWDHMVHLTLWTGQSRFKGLIIIHLMQSCRKLYFKLVNLVLYNMIVIVIRIKIFLIFF